MSTRVEKTITVNVPVSQAYNQWTQFEDFPHFMDGVKSVSQLSDDRLAWVAEIAGVKREWEAQILEQVPDEKVAWAATEGAANAGAVTFRKVGRDQCTVTLVLDYEPEGLVEKAGDALNIVGRRAEADLERFKAHIESEGHPTGAWRGTVSQAGAGSTWNVDDGAGSNHYSGSGSTPTAAAARPPVKSVVAQPDSLAATNRAETSDRPRTLTSREVREAGASEAPAPSRSGSAG